MNDLILIVEDEAATAEILADYLRLDSYKTHLLTEGTSVVSWVREHKPALQAMVLHKDCRTLLFLVHTQRVAWHDLLPV